MGDEALTDVDGELKAVAEKWRQELVEAIASVEVRSKPFARATGGFKYIYRITWSTLDPFQVPALSLLSARMLDILAAWSTEEVVELEVAVPNLELNLAFTQRTHG